MARPPLASGTGALGVDDTLAALTGWATEASTSANTRRVTVRYGRLDGTTERPTSSFRLVRGSPADADRQVRRAAAAWRDGASLRSEALCSSSSGGRAGRQLQGGVAAFRSRDLVVRFERPALPPAATPLGGQLSLMLTLPVTRWMP